MFSSILSFILEALFPRECIICGSDGEHICRACEKSIICKPKTILTPSTHLASITICTDYRDPHIRKLITAFKFEGIRDLAKPLGQLMLHGYASFTLPPETVIIPIPLHRRRERSRGYNQSMLLAEIVQRKKNLILDTRLRRKRATNPQHTLHRAERLRTIKGVYGYRGSAPRSVLLIDDIATTYATLEEAASELKKHGAHTVHALVLAKNDP